MRGKIAMPVIAALLVLGVIGGSAALAAPPTGLESYDAGATTTALDLAVAGQDGLVVGNTVAVLTSEGPKSIGDGSALLIGGSPASEGEPAKAPEGPAESQDCPIEIGSQIPSPLDTASVEIGCVNFTAPDTEHSTSASESATIGVLGSGLSDQLEDALLGPLFEGLAPVLEGVDGGLSQVCQGLVDAGLPLTGEDCSTQAVVDQVSDQIGDPDSAIVTIQAAPGNSSTSADDVDGVVAHALSNGAVIKVFPNALLYGTDDFGEPNAALTIRVGVSEAMAVADPVTGDITTSASVGLVTVEAGTVADNAIAQLLDLSDDGVIQQIVTAINEGVAALADANALACGEGSPLEDVICLDAAEAKTDLDQAAIAAIRPEFDFGAGTMGARASALGVRLLSAAQEGGLVSLYLADAVAAVNAVPATPVITTTVPPTTPEPLPKTGSNDFTPLILAAGLGLGAVALRMRRNATR